MQSTHHVHLGDPEPESFAHRTHDFVDRVLERVGIAFLGSKSAELAGENADVRIVDVAIVNVGREVAVLSLAYDIGHHSQRIQVVRLIQIDSVRVGNSLTRLNFLRN